MIKLLESLRKKITPEINYILIIFLFTRVMLTIIGCLSYIILDPKLPPRKYEITFSKHLWLDVWGVWDTFWYVDIATRGYSTAPPPIAGLEHQANYPFFPLYPILMKVLGTLIGDNFIAGIILSNIFMIAACIFIYKLVKLNSDEDTALRSIKYLFLFPTAFILSGVFTEPLFLALTIICFYYAKKDKWHIVGIMGFLVSLTRPNGFWLILPLSYEYLRQKHFSLRNIRIDVLYLLLLPLGFGLFYLYVAYLTKDPWAFSHIQSAWNVEFDNPLRVLWKGFFSHKTNYLFATYFTTVWLVFLTVSYRKIDFSQWLFGMYMILVPLSAGLDAIPRYILPVFPLYILLAQIKKDSPLDQAVTISLALLQGFLMVFWAMNFDLIV